MSKIGWFGVIVSVLYLGFILWFAGDRIAELKTTDLNNLGDFLAGAFGPLAIFWLILGFFQQGRELRASVEALKLQSEELAASVEQQKALVSITKDQLNLDQVAYDQNTQRVMDAELPHIVVSSAGHTRSGGRTIFRFEIVNTGKTSVETGVDIWPKMESWNRRLFKPLPPNDIRRFDVNVENSSSNLSGTNFMIVSQNSLGWLKNQKFELKEDGQFQVHHPEVHTSRQS